MHIQDTKLVYMKSSINLVTREKLYWWLSLSMNINHVIKEMGYKMVVLFVSFIHLKKVVTRRLLYWWMGLLTNKNVLEKKWMLKFVVLLISVTIVWWQQVHLRMYAYHYSLFESGTESGLWAITLCSKDMALLCVNTNNNSKVDYYLNDNW